MLKYVAQAGRVSQWIASKLQSSVAKNMLFPSCSDIRLPHLMAADHPEAGHARAAFLAALHGAQGTAPAQPGLCKKCGLAGASTGSAHAGKVCACFLQQCLAGANPTAGQVRAACVAALHSSQDSAW